MNVLSEIPQWPLASRLDEVPTRTEIQKANGKFHPRLQGIQSATGENLTAAAQIADRWIRLVL